MSCEVSVKTFKEIEEVRIECCDKNEIETLEKSIISSIEQKLEKLNIIIKNCNVYGYGDFLFVNDRYNICSSLIEIATAFGLNVKQIQCPLKGNNYIITDELLTILKQFDREIEFGRNVINQKMSEQVMSIISQNTNETIIDSDILMMVKNIKRNGQYVTTRTREIIETTEDGYLIERYEGQWMSDVNKIKEKLTQISRNSKDIVNKTNAQLRDGTAKLIYTRARQMGYSVQEVKKGTQTQLVLVRCE